MAVNNAGIRDTIIVRNNTYFENVVVNVPLLIIKSEYGPENCNVVGFDIYDHVFDITAGGVKIIGFNITNGFSGFNVSSGVTIENKNKRIIPNDKDFLNK
jgi:hypothetical protein